MDGRRDGLIKHMKSIGTGLWTLIGMACVALAAIGCGGTGGSSTQLPDPTVRFVNATPDSTALDFYVDLSVKANNLAYLGSSPSFASMGPGDFDLSVAEDGAADQLDVAAFTLARNKDYLVLALGQENFGSEPIKRTRLLPFEIDRKTPNGNKARLIVVHAFSRSAGNETPNIDFQNPGDNPQFKLSNIAFGATQTIVVDSGDQQFQAKRNGGEQVYVEKTLTLGAGKVYLVLVTGIEGAAAPQAPDIQLIELQTRAL